MCGGGSPMNTAPLYQMLEQSDIAGVFSGFYLNNKSLERKTKIWMCMMFLHYYLV